MANPIVTGLPAYVEEQRLPLISKAVLGAKTADMLSLMTGVKGETALNLINTDIAIQNASSCGFSASGNTELSQRNLKPAYLKVNMEYCEKNLLGKWAAYKVRTAADNTALSFEEDYMRGVAEQIAKAGEKMIWRGQSGQTDQFEGIISLLEGADPVAVTGDSATTTYEAIKKVYLAMPAEAVADDTRIFVSIPVFNQFIQELVEKNLYHFKPSDVEGEYTLPGTGVKVVSVPGLAPESGDTDDYIVAGRLSNIFYGVDLENEDEIFDFWYSKDDRIFKLDVEWIAGVQIAFPDQMVLGKFERG